MEKTTAKNPQKLEGVVVSTKMKDTAVVRVDRYVKHPKYEKFFKKSATFKVHDAGNTKAVGEKVVIIACRPISKDKRFTMAN